MLNHCAEVLRRALEEHPWIVVNPADDAISLAAGRPDPRTVRDASRGPTKVLRFTTLLCKNTCERGVYKSLEVVVRFITARDDELAFAALATLVALHSSSMCVSHRDWVNGSPPLKSRGGELAAMMSRRLRAIVLASSRAAGEASPPLRLAPIAGDMSSAATVGPSSSSVHGADSRDGASFDAASAGGGSTNVVGESGSVKEICFPSDLANRPFSVAYDPGGSRLRVSGISGTESLSSSGPLGEGLVEGATPDWLTVEKFLAASAQFLSEPCLRQLAALRQELLWRIRNSRMSLEDRLRTRLASLTVLCRVWPDCLLSNKKLTVLHISTVVSRLSADHTLETACEMELLDPSSTSGDLAAPLPPRAIAASSPSTDVDMVDQIATPVDTLVGDSGRAPADATCKDLRGALSGLPSTHALGCLCIRHLASMPLQAVPVVAKLVQVPLAKLCETLNADGTSNAASLLIRSCTIIRNFWVSIHDGSLPASDGDSCRLNEAVQRAVCVIHMCVQLLRVPSKIEDDLRSTREALSALLRALPSQAVASDNVPDDARVALCLSRIVHAIFELLPPQRPLGDQSFIGHSGMKHLVQFLCGMAAPGSLGNGGGMPAPLDPSDYSSLDDHLGVLDRVLKGRVAQHSDWVSRLAHWREGSPLRQLAPHRRVIVSSCMSLLRVIAEIEGAAAGMGSLFAEVSVVDEPTGQPPDSDVRTSAPIRSDADAGARIAEDGRPRDPTGAAPRAAEELAPESSAHPDRTAADRADVTAESFTNFLRQVFRCPAFFGPQVVGHICHFLILFLNADPASASRVDKSGVASDALDCVANQRIPASPVSVSMLPRLVAALALARPVSKRLSSPLNGQSVFRALMSLCTNPRFSDVLAPSSTSIVAVTSDSAPYGAAHVARAAYMIGLRRRIESGAFTGAHNDFADGIKTILASHSTLRNALISAACDQLSLTARLCQQSVSRGPHALFLAEQYALNVAAAVVEALGSSSLQGASQLATRDGIRHLSAIYFSILPAPSVWLSSCVAIHSASRSDLAAAFGIASRGLVPDPYFNSDGSPDQASSAASSSSAAQFLLERAWAVGSESRQALTDCMLRVLHSAPRWALPALCREAQRMMDSIPSGPADTSLAFENILDELPNEDLCTTEGSAALELPTGLEAAFTTLHALICASWLMDLLHAAAARDAPYTRVTDRVEALGGEETRRVLERAGALSRAAALELSRFLVARSTSTPSELLVGEHVSIRDVGAAALQQFIDSTADAVSSVVSATFSRAVGGSAGPMSPGRARSARLAADLIHETILSGRPIAAGTQRGWFIDDSATVSNVLSRPSDARLRRVVYLGVVIKTLRACLGDSGTGPKVRQLLIARLLHTGGLRSIMDAIAWVCGAGCGGRAAEGADNGGSMGAVGNPAAAPGRPASESKVESGLQESKDSGPAKRRRLDSDDLRPDDSVAERDVHAVAAARSAVANADVERTHPAVAAALVSLTSTMLAVANPESLTKASTRQGETTVVMLARAVRDVILVGVAPVWQLPRSWRCSLPFEAHANLLRLIASCGLMWHSVPSDDPTSSVALRRNTDFVREYAAVVSVHGIGDEQTLGNRNELDALLEGRESESRASDDSLPRRRRRPRRGIRGGEDIADVSSREARWRARALTRRSRSAAAFSSSLGHGRDVLSTAGTDGMAAMLLAARHAAAELGSRASGRRASGADDTRTSEQTAAATSQTASGLPSHVGSEMDDAGREQGAQRVPPGPPSSHATAGDVSSETDAASRTAASTTAPIGGAAVGSTPPSVPMPPIPAESAGPSLLPVPRQDRADDVMNVLTSASRDSLPELSGIFAPLLDLGIPLEPIVQAHTATGSRDVQVLIDWIFSNPGTALASQATADGSRMGASAPTSSSTSSRAHQHTPRDTAAHVGNSSAERASASGEQGSATGARASALAPAASDATRDAAMRPGAAPKVDGATEHEATAVAAAATSKTEAGLRQWAATVRQAALQYRRSFGARIVELLLHAPISSPAVLLICSQGRWQPHHLRRAGYEEGPEHPVTTLLTRSAPKTQEAIAALAHSIRFAAEQESVERERETAAIVTEVESVSLWWHIGLCVRTALQLAADRMVGATRGGGALCGMKEAGAATTLLKFVCSLLEMCDTGAGKSTQSLIGALLQCHARLRMGVDAVSSPWGLLCGHPGGKLADTAVSIGKTALTAATEWNTVARDRVHGEFPESAGAVSPRTACFATAALMQPLISLMALLWRLPRVDAVHVADADSSTTAAAAQWFDETQSQASLRPSISEDTAQTGAAGADEGRTAIMRTIRVSICMAARAFTLSAKQAKHSVELFVQLLRSNLLPIKTVRRALHALVQVLGVRAAVPLFVEAGGPAALLSMRVPDPALTTKPGSRVSRKAAVVLSALCAREIGRVLRVVVIRPLAGLQAAQRALREAVEGQIRRCGKCEFRDIVNMTHLMTRLAQAPRTFAVALHTTLRFVDGAGFKVRDKSEKDRERLQDKIASVVTRPTSQGPVRTKFLRDMGGAEAVLEDWLAAECFGGIELNADTFRVRSIVEAVATATLRGMLDHGAGLVAGAAPVHDSADRVDTGRSPGLAVAMLRARELLRSTGTAATDHTSVSLAEGSVGGLVHGMEAPSFRRDDVLVALCDAVTRSRKLHHCLRAARPSDFPGLSYIESSLQGAWISDEPLLDLLLAQVAAGDRPLSTAAARLLSGMCRVSRTTREVVSTHLVRFIVLAVIPLSTKRPEPSGDPVAIKRAREHVDASAVSHPSIVAGATSSSLGETTSSDDGKRRRLSTRPDDAALLVARASPVSPGHRVVTLADEDDEDENDDDSPLCMLGPAMGRVFSSAGAPVDISTAFVVKAHAGIDMVHYLRTSRSGRAAAAFLFGYGGETAQQEALVRVARLANHILELPSNGRHPCVDLARAGAVSAIVWALRRVDRTSASAHDMFDALLQTLLAMCRKGALAAIRSPERADANVPRLSSAAERLGAPPMISGAHEPSAAPRRTAPHSSLHSRAEGQPPRLSSDSSRERVAAATSVAVHSRATVPITNRMTARHDQSRTVALPASTSIASVVSPSTAPQHISTSTAPALASLASPVRRTMSSGGTSSEDGLDDGDRSDDPSAAAVGIDDDDADDSTGDGGANSDDDDADGHDGGGDDAADEADPDGELGDNPEDGDEAVDDDRNRISQSDRDELESTDVPDLVEDAIDSSGYQRRPSPAMSPSTTSLGRSPGRRPGTSSPAPYEVSLAWADLDSDLFAPQADSEPDDEIPVDAYAEDDADAINDDDEDSRTVYFSPDGFRVGHPLRRRQQSQIIHGVYATMEDPDEEPGALRARAADAHRVRSVFGGDSRFPAVDGVRETDLMEEPGATQEEDLEGEYVEVSEGELSDVGANSGRLERRHRQRSRIERSHPAFARGRIDSQGLSRSVAGRREAHSSAGYSGVFGDPQSSSPQLAGHRRRPRRFGLSAMADGGRRDNRNVAGTVGQLLSMMMHYDIGTTDEPNSRAERAGQPAPPLLQRFSGSDPTDRAAAGARVSASHTSQQGILGSAQYARVVERALSDESGLRTSRPRRRSPHAGSGLAAGTEARAAPPTLDALDSVGVHRVDASASRPVSHSSTTPSPTAGSRRPPADDDPQSFDGEEMAHQTAARHPGTPGESGEDGEHPAMPDVSVRADPVVGSPPPADHGDRSPESHAQRLRTHIPASTGPEIAGSNSAGARGTVESEPVSSERADPERTSGPATAVAPRDRAPVAGTPTASAVGLHQTEEAASQGRRVGATSPGSSDGIGQTPAGAVVSQQGGAVPPAGIQSGVPLLERSERSSPVIESQAAGAVAESERSSPVIHSQAAGAVVSASATSSSGTSSAGDAAAPSAGAAPDPAVAVADPDNPRPGSSPPAAAAEAAEMAAFLATLDPEVREEALLAVPMSVAVYFPDNLRAQVLAVRDEHGLPFGDALPGDTQRSFGGATSSAAGGDTSWVAVSLPGEVVEQSVASGASRRPGRGAQSSGPGSASRFVREVPWPRGSPEHTRDARQHTRASRSAWPEACGAVVAVETGGSFVAFVPVDDVLEPLVRDSDVVAILRALYVRGRFPSVTVRLLRVLSGYGALRDSVLAAVHMRLQAITAGMTDEHVRSSTVALRLLTVLDTLSRDARVLIPAVFGRAFVELVLLVALNRFSRSSGTQRPSAIQERAITFLKRANDVLHAWATARLIHMRRETADTEAATRDTHSPREQAHPRESSTPPSIAGRGSTFASETADAARDPAPPFPAFDPSLRRKLVLDGQPILSETTWQLALATVLEDTWNVDLFRVVCQLAATLSAIPRNADALFSEAQRRVKVVLQEVQDRLIRDCKLAQAGDHTWSHPSSADDQLLRLVQIIVAVGKVQRSTTASGRAVVSEATRVWGVLEGTLDVTLAAAGANGGNTGAPERDGQPLAAEGQDPAAAGAGGPTDGGLRLGSRRARSDSIASQSGQRLSSTDPAALLMLRRFKTLVTALFLAHDRGGLGDVDDPRLAQLADNLGPILNAAVRAEPELLETDLSLLVRSPALRGVLEFDNKRAHFERKLRSFRTQHRRAFASGLRLRVRRNALFEDSYALLRNKTASEMRGRLSVRFQGEEGVDAGGLTREWYSLLSRQIFNPGYALFMPSADSPSFQPNPLSYVNDEHLGYFRFVGRIIGKAIVDGQVLDVHFTRR